ncbi:MlaA family lipoprotein [Silvimonas iriomotensis]|nr:VacJ family lipoprotein [Silvimonas iriomotensis]
MRRLVPIAALLLTACASPKNNYDPLEPVNRGIFVVNNVVDRAVVKPVATAYSNYAPGPVKQGTSNFFGNIDDLFSALGSVLEGNFKDAGVSFGRVAVNTSIGLLGIFDWASDMNMPKPDQDLGLALGHWGIGSGPYIMLPFLGPTTLRDAVDPTVRWFYGPGSYLNTTGEQIAWSAVDGINLRAQVLPLDQLIESQPDPYAYIRDAYLQRRWYKVYDGKPPHPLQLGDIDDDDGADDAAPAAKPAASASEPAAADKPAAATETQASAAPQAVAASAVAVEPATADASAPAKAEQ